MHFNFSGKKPLLPAETLHGLQRDCEQGSVVFFHGSHPAILMYFLFRETKFPAPKLKLADPPNARGGASLGTRLELRISPPLVPVAHYKLKSPAFLLLYLPNKKKELFILHPIE